MRLAVSKFTGLDVRRLAETSDPRSARAAVNLDLTQGGEYESREPTEQLMSLDPQSVGLYVLSGTLRSAAPGGRGVPLQAVGPVSVTYDHVGIGDASYQAVVVDMLGGLTVRMRGTVWPAWSVGATLTVGAYSATVLSVSGDDATMSAAYTNTPGVFPFTLVNGGDNLASRTVTLTAGSTAVALVNGTWPASIEGATLYIQSEGFTASVALRTSDTVIQLSSEYTGQTESGLAFTLSGGAAAYPTGALVRVSAVESIGADASYGAYPYLCLERYINPAAPEQGTQFEHHWVTRQAVSPTVPVATRMELPFSPGADVIQASGKLWASDDTNGVVRFSSTANGPRDWTTPEDAGYIPIITHTSGDRRIRGLGIYDDKLAVIFSDAVQLWATDPQPTNITLVRVVEGPGTTNPQSVVNVLGDLFYLTRGGFRSLHTAVVTGQLQEQDDIGTKIDDLVQADKTPVSAALWSQARGQYLCALGSRIYAFRYSPKTKVMGWTVWDLPFTVTAMVELSGVLYFRSADHKLHRMREGATEQVSWELRLNDIAAKDPTRRKRFDGIDVFQRGKCATTFFTEPDDDTYYADGPILDGTTTSDGTAYVGVMARTLGVKFTGTGTWRLSSLLLTYLDLGN